jgi:hypothetical protein
MKNFKKLLCNVTGSSVITLFLTLLLVGTALAAATYDLLIGDNSTFTSGVGDWTVLDWGVISHEPNDGNAANGALKVTSVKNGNYYSGRIQSACYLIDFANWPENSGQKTIWLSGYGKNVTTAYFDVQLSVFSENDCDDMAPASFAFAPRQTATTWTAFEVGKDMNGLGWTPRSVQVLVLAGEFNGTQAKTYLVDDLKLYSSTPTAITLQSFGARDGAGLAYLGVVPLALVFGVVGVVLYRKKR